MTRPPRLTPAYARRVLIALSLLLLAVLVLALQAGPVHVDWGEILAGNAPESARAIVFRVRLPRILLGAVVGAGLAVSGCALQAMLRNPLAEPHLLGISGGAALGGILGLLAASWLSIDAAIAAPAAAFGGGLVALWLIYRLGSSGGRADPQTLLLAGVVCNALAGALILLINTVVDIFQARGMLFWLMGSLQTTRYGVVLGAAAYMAAGFAWLAHHARPLDALGVGEEGAMQLGVDVERTRRAAFFAASLLVGASVSVSGMIGFVGLVVPHAGRLLFGPDHRLLLPVSALLGAAFLVAADTVARIALAPAEIPVGVVTALCGAPFFLYLLRRQLRRGGRP